MCVHMCTCAGAMVGVPADSPAPPPRPLALASHLSIKATVSEVPDIVERDKATPLCFVLIPGPQICRVWDVFNRMARVTGTAVAMASSFQKPVLVPHVTIPLSCGLAAPQPQAVVPAPGATQRKEPSPDGQDAPSASQLQ